MMEATQLLVLRLLEKDRLTEPEFCLYQAMVAYLELQYRLLAAVTKKQAAVEGFTDEELRGYSEATSE